MLYGQPYLRGIVPAIPADYPLDVLYTQIQTLSAVEGAVRTSLSSTDPVIPGLAANQIGLPLRLFVSSKITGQVTAFLNPTLEWGGNEVTATQVDAACASLPTFTTADMVGCQTISRYSSITLSYQTLTETNGAYQLSSFTSTTYDNTNTDDNSVFYVQQLVDYLNGLLFIDYANLNNINNTSLSDIYNGSVIPGYNALSRTNS
jgi:peptide deformylase